MNDLLDSDLLNMAKDLVRFNNMTWYELSYSLNAYASLGEFYKSPEREAPLEVTIKLLSIFKKCSLPLPYYKHSIDSICPAALSKPSHAFLQTIEARAPPAGFALYPEDKPVPENISVKLKKLNDTEEAASKAFPEDVFSDWALKISALQNFQSSLKAVMDGKMEPDEDVVINFGKCYEDIVKGPASLIVKQYNACMTQVIAGYSPNKDGLADFPRDSKLNLDASVLKRRSDWWTVQEWLDGKQFSRWDALYNWMKQFVVAAKIFFELVNSTLWMQCDLRKFGSNLYDVFLSHRGPSEKTLMTFVMEYLKGKGIQAFLDHDILKGSDHNVVEMALAVVRSSTTLVVLDPQFFTSKWCAAEQLLAAAAARKNVSSTHRFFLYVPNNMDLTDFSGVVKNFSFFSENCVYVEEKQHGKQLLDLLSGIQEFVVKQQAVQKNSNAPKKSIVAPLLRVDSDASVHCKQLWALAGTIQTKNLDELHFDDYQSVFQVLKTVVGRHLGALKTATGEKLNWLNVNLTLQEAGSRSHGTDLADTEMDVMVVLNSFGENQELAFEDMVLLLNKALVDNLTVKLLWDELGFSIDEFRKLNSNYMDLTVHESKKVVSYSLKTSLWKRTRIVKFVFALRTFSGFVLFGADGTLSPSRDEFCEDSWLAYAGRCGGFVELAKAIKVLAIQYNVTHTDRPALKLAAVEDAMVDVASKIGVDDWNRSRAHSFAFLVSRVFFRLSDFGRNVPDLIGAFRKLNKNLAWITTYVLEF